MWNIPDRVLDLLQEHIARRPWMELRDVYKLIYQGMCGPEHLVADPLEFATWFRRDWENLAEPDENELLIESIRAGGGLLRVNLRPFKANNNKLDDLIKACLHTAQRKWGTPDELRFAWQLVTNSVQNENRFSFKPAQIVEFSLWLDDQDYPPIHHSDSYRRLYRPAYRLVCKEEWEGWVILIRGNQCV